MCTDNRKILELHLKNPKLIIVRSSFYIMILWKKDIFVKRLYRCDLKYLIN